MNPDERDEERESIEYSDDDGRRRRLRLQTIKWREIEGAAGGLRKSLDETAGGDC